MRKRILISLLVLFALVIGFLIGQNTTPIEKLKIVKEQVVDTVYQSKLIEVEVEKPVKHVDTVFLPVNDSVSDITQFSEQDVDTLDIDTEEDSLQIIRDERLKSERLEVIVIKDEETDTLLEKLLNVETIKAKQILVEYWESPLNYKGYKLSKSKLVVYGIVPLSTGVIYRDGPRYYFRSNGLFYELTETADFKKMSPISKPTSIHD